VLILVVVAAAVVDIVVAASALTLGVGVVVVEVSHLVIDVLGVVVDFVDVFDYAVVGVGIGVDDYVGDGIAFVVEMVVVVTEGVVADAVVVDKDFEKDVGDEGWTSGVVVGGDGHQGKNAEEVKGS